MSVDVPFPSAISRYLVSNEMPTLLMRWPAMRFPSAISRYLVSNVTFSDKVTDGNSEVSIRYIAVLGFQQVPGFAWNLPSCVSIRYIAVLGFQQVPGFAWNLPSCVSIRYIAVLGFQPGRHAAFCVRPLGFHPLYRGTWFPTSVRGDLIGTGWVVSIRYIAVLGFQREHQLLSGWRFCEVSIRYIAVLGFQRRRSGGR